MIKTKLISLLRSFSKKELKEFQDFVDSPYFTKEKSFGKMVFQIRKAFESKNDLYLSKENIYKKIYPKRAYSDEHIRNIISRVLKMAEEYVTIRELENEKNFKMLLRMRALSDKNQNYLFEKTRKEAKRIIDEGSYRDSEHYYTSLMYEDEIRRFAMREKSKYIVKNDNIQKITDNVIYYSFVELLKLYAVMTNYKKHLMDAEFDFTFMDNLLEYYESNREFFNNIPYAHLYYNSIKLFITEDEKYFNNVNEIIHKNYDSFNEIDRKNAYVVLVNYCSERINKGDLSFLRKKFKLYKEIIEKGAHYEGLPYISHIFYARVSYAAINIGELEWALNFIEKYKKELNKEHNDNSYFIAMSEYHLKLGNFDQALENLSNAQRSDHEYKLEIYPLLLKIYYNSGLEESFYREAENFKNFLKSNKHVTRRSQELGSNFIRLMKNLVRVKQKIILGKKYDIYSLRKKILDNKYITDKFWLLERLEELEKK